MKSVVITSAAVALSVAVAAAALQAVAQPAAAAGDPARGAQLFAAQCALCHVNTKDAEVKVGPTLWGVAGRKAAAVPGFTYSTALRATGWTWDDAHLQAFLANPPEAVPGTTMPVAVPAEADRRDLIAYLHQLDDSDAKSPSKSGATTTP